MSFDVPGAIVAAANKYGVDPDFALSIGRAESNLQANPPPSSAGAIGTMQLMPGTAHDLGVTDPADAAQNIDGGVRYLAQLQRHFGDPTLTAAAYNAGPGAVIAHGGVPPYRETQAYVQKVMGGATPAPKTPPTSELDAIFGVSRGQPAGSPSAGPTPAPQAASQPSVSVADLDSAFGIQRAQAAPAALPVSVAQAAANKDAQAGIQKSAAIAPWLAGSGKTATGIQAVTNSALLSAAPLLAGGEAALNNVGQGALSAVGLAPKPTYGPGEAFTANRDAYHGMLTQQGQAHPVVSALGNVGGIIASGPADLIDQGIVRGVEHFAPQAGKTLAGRIATKGAGAAAVGGVYGTNQGLSEGQSLPDALKTGGETAALTAPFGVLGGAVGEVAPHIPAFPMRRAVLPVAGAATGALVGANTNGGGLPNIAQDAALGALLGRSAGGRGITEAAPTVADRNAALDIAAKAVPPDGSTALPHTVAADAVEQGLAQTGAPTTAQALGQTGVDLTGKVAAVKPTAVEPLQTTVNSHVAEAPARVLGGFQEATGIDPTTADLRARGAIQDAAQSPEGTAALASDIQERQQPAAVRDRVVSDIQGATKIDPATAQMSAEDQAEAARSGPIREAYDAAITGRGVWTPELSEFVNANPQVAQAIRLAQADITAKGRYPAQVENPSAQVPRYTENGQAHFNATDLKNLTPDQADRLFNQGDLNAVPTDTSQPAHIPTDAVLDRAKRYIDRNYDATNPLSRDVARSLGAQYRAILDKPNALGEPYAKARGLAGDTISAEEARDASPTLGASGANAETAAAHGKRFAAMSPGDQTADRAGTLAKLYQGLDARGLGSGVGSPRDQAILSTQHGPEAAQHIMDSLARERANAAERPAPGLEQVLDRRLREGEAAAAGTLSGPSLASFKADFAKMSPREQDMVRQGVAARINRLAEANKLSAEKLLNNPAQLEVIRTVFGDAAAGKFIGALRKEVALAKSAGDIAKVKGKPPAQHEGVATGVGLSILEHGANPRAIAEGAALGLGMRSARNAFDSLRSGGMNPRVASALGDILEQHPSITATQLRQRASERRSVPLSDSTLKGVLAEHALRGIAVGAGQGTRHALSGLFGPDREQLGPAQ